MKEYLFTFEWTDGNKSANDYIRQWCKENHINFGYDLFQRLVANVHKRNCYSRFEYKKISDNLYGVRIAE